MRILIVSDTHRKNDNFFRAVEEAAPIDMVIHCGDAEGSEYTISEGAGCPVQIVLGNNDFFSNLPRELMLEIAGYKVWVTHGHNYYVSMNHEIIMEEARSRGADIVMYGHTHKPAVEIKEDLIAVNPGSLSYPRQDGRRPSYLVMEAQEGKAAEFHIHYL